LHHTLFAGDREMWENDAATFADFDSIINTGGSDGSGSFTSVLTAGEYVLTITGTYTFPHKYVTLTTSLSAPVSHIPGTKMFFYAYMDNGYEDDDAFDNDVSYLTPNPLSIGSAVAFPPANGELTNIAMYYVSGLPWTGWVVGEDECGISKDECENYDPRFGPEAGAIDANDFNKNVWSSGGTDSGAAFSVYLGDTAGVHTTVWALGMAPASEIPPFGTTIRDNSIAIAYWIGESVGRRPFSDFQTFT
jgi:hypothetical protein